MGKLVFGCVYVYFSTVFSEAVENERESDRDRNIYIGHVDKNRENKRQRQTLQIAFHHLESFPRMKYNNRIITKGI